MAGAIGGGRCLIVKGGLKMSVYLIVDGYNIINAWPDLKVLAEDNLEAARLKLIDCLTDYIFLWDKITVVFDAHLVPMGSGTRENFNSIEIIYTREGETADNVIEKITHKFKGNSNIDILVATSDWAQQQTILSRGARRISARELKQFLTSIKQDIRNEYIENIFLIKKNSLDNLLEKDVKAKLDKWRYSGKKIMS